MAEQEHQGVNEQDYVGYGISKTTGRRHDINHLPENAFWETGVYQYEQNDKLIGGIDGIDNLQGQQLTNRTVYLKKKLEEQGERIEEIAGQGSASVFSKDLTIPTTGWAAEESSSEYAYHLDIADENITADMTPFLVFATGNTGKAEAAGIGSACETLAGKLRIYAAAIPTSEISATLYLFGASSGVPSLQLPIASTTRAGVVKIGDNIDVTADGTISVSDDVVVADTDGNGVADVVDNSMATDAEVKNALDQIGL